MPRTKDPKLEEDRLALVTDATIELLAATSWRSVTLEKVARQAGLSKGAVTYWFASKDDLLVAAVERFHATYGEDLAQVAATPGPVRERLERLLALAFPDQPTVERELRFQTEVWSYAKERPEVLHALRERYGRFRAACEALVELGVAEGYVTREDREGLYFFVHALIDGVSIHVAFDPDADVPAVRAKLIELLERWFRD